ncbi:MAG: type II toxin-antitoxin system HicB family antitoxin [Acidimicrobiales bacterium]
MRQVKAELHYTVNIDEEDGCYWAEIVELPGCFVWGRSMEEIRAGLSEAVNGTSTTAGVQVVLRDLQVVPDGAVDGLDDAPLGELVPLAAHRPASG